MTLTTDGLQNMVARLGGAGDKAAYDTYGLPWVNQTEIDNAYRSSGWFRKICDILPDDETRAGRSWQAEQSQIQAIEAEQTRLGVLHKIREARTFARKDGWALLLLGGPGDPAQELRPDMVGRNGLQFLTVINRSEMALAEMETNPLSPWYGMPVRGQVIAGSVLQDVHPSRFVLFTGNKPRTFARMSGVWGDSLWLTLQRDIKNADLAPAVVASLLHEAKLDVLALPDFMSSVATAEYEDLLMRRIALAQTLKSMQNTLVIDAEDTHTTKQLSWAGLPDIMTKFLEILAGVSGIPATRLLGKSPDGMNATGESDLQNYADLVNARQKMEIEPLIAPVLDECLIRSALGARPAEIWYTWNPLYKPSAKVQADTQKVRAETFKLETDSGAFDDDMLAKVYLNSAVESGLYPGLEQEMAERPDEGVTDPDEQEAAEIARLTAQAEQATLPPPARQVTADATPRSLYIRRDVLNSAELVAWAKGQGFPTVQDGLHVTVIHTRTPLDWVKVGSAAEWGPADGGMVVPAGGPRLMERFGDAVVLQFANGHLAWRHEDIVRMGAAADFPDYQPHITITWQMPEGMDLADVEPYRGQIKLGPEIFEEVDDDWRATVTEA